MTRHRTLRVLALALAMLPTPAPTQDEEDEVQPKDVLLVCPDDEPIYSSGLRSYNRYSSSGVGEAVGATFDLTPDAVASYRFTNRGQRTVDRAWLYYETRGSATMTYRVSLHADTCGLPKSKRLATKVFEAHPPTGAASWHSVALATGDPLPDGEVFHLVVEHASGGSATEAIVLHAAGNRAPVPFQPYDHAGGASRVSGIDENFALLYGSGEGGEPRLLVQRKGNESFSPLFLLEASDAPVALGNPYDTHDDPEVCGLAQVGQRIRPDADLSINHVGFFARAGGTPGNGKPKAPLTVRLQELETDGTRTPLATTRLDFLPFNLVYGRSHYYTGYFGEAQTLSSGSTYELVLLAGDQGTACGKENNRWVTSVESSTLVPDHSVLPTFGARTSHAFLSTDGGTTVTDFLDGDLPFLLSELPDEPLAHLDEFAGTGDSGVFPLELQEGEAFQLLATVRNLGRTADRGRIYARLRDRQASPNAAPLSSFFSNEVLDNDQEAPIFQLASAMPGRDLHLWLEVGHLDGLGNEVIDEQTPMEIRLK